MFGDIIIYLVYIQHLAHFIETAFVYISNISP